MNKFDLRKYFKFNVLLESVEEDEFPYKDSKVAIEKSHFNNTKDVKKIEGILETLESVSNIKPIKRTTLGKNAFGGFEEKEDENGERFLFRSFEDMNIFKTQLVKNGIKFFAQGYTTDDPYRKEDK